MQVSMLQLKTFACVLLLERRWLLSFCRKGLLEVPATRTRAVGDCGFPGGTGTKGTPGPGTMPAVAYALGGPAVGEGTGTACRCLVLGGVCV